MTTKNQTGYFLAVIFSDGSEPAEILGLFAEPTEALDQIKTRYDGEDIWVKDQMKKYGTFNISISSPKNVTAQVIKMTIGEEVNINV